MSPPVPSGCEKIKSLFFAKPVVPFSPLEELESKPESAVFKIKPAGTGIVTTALVSWVRYPLPTCQPFPS